jgi:hypothetical protein
VKRIVDFINATTKCKHKQLLEALAPTPAPATPVSTEAPTAEGQPAAEAAPAAPEPSSELATVMINLHWLLHQGHVIEFANGVLETAKKPLPRPVKPVKATAQPAAANAVDAAIAATPETGEVTGGDAHEATSPAEPLASNATVEPAATPGVEAAPVSSATPPVG